VTESFIDLAKHWPCTECGAGPGEECWPRLNTDFNWIHTERRKTMLASHFAQLGVK